MRDIRVGDFRELAGSLSNDSIDMVMTDPPYDKKSLPLFGDLGRVAARVLKPSGYLVTYSGTVWLNKVMAQLEQYLNYYIIISNDEPGGHSRINARAVFQEWKALLVYQKSPLKRLNKWGPNKVTSPAPSKNNHKWEQSLEPVRNMVERFSRPGDLVLDPFLGGGTTAVACDQLGRDCIGFDIDPEAVEMANRRLAQPQQSLFVVNFVEQQLALVGA